MSNQTKLLQALLFLTILFVASYSVLQQGMFAVHDFLHTARIAEMTRGLQDGQFPVIWTQSFAYGLGTALFEYYSPLPYFIGSVLYLLTSNALVATKVFWILPTFIIATGTYFLAKKLVHSSWLALASTALVTLAPYRAVQLYVRGSLAEAWAMSCYVWLLFGLTMVVRKQKYGRIVFIISSLALILSHNISILLAVVPTILFWIGLTYQQINHCDAVISDKSWKKWVLAFAEIATLSFIIIGLSSFYSFPSVFEKDFTKLDQYVMADYFDYSNHFVFIRQLVIPSWGYGGSEWGPNDQLSYFLGFSQLILFGIALAFGILALFNKIQFKEKYVFFSLLLCSAFSLFMVTGRSSFIWQSINYLSYIQFPWRFLGMASIFIGLVAVWPLTTASKRNQLYLSVLIVITAFIPGLLYFQPESRLDVTSQYYFSNANDISMKLSQYLPDYDYNKISNNNRTIQNPECRSVDATQLRTEGCTLVKQQFSSKNQMWRVVVDQPSLIVLPIANYPGWRVTLDGKAFEQQEYEGKIAVDLESGSHVVELGFRSTSVRNLGKIITVCTLTVLISYYIVAGIRLTKYKGSSSEHST